MKKIVKIWKSTDEQHRRAHQGPRLSDELHQMESFAATMVDPGDERKLEEVTKAEREKAEALLHRLHRAAGHPSNMALARLCKERQLPAWLVTLASQLVCQACVDTQRGEQKILPYSLGSKPVPWQMVAMDVMEIVFPDHRVKTRFLVMTDMVTKFSSMRILWKGPITEAGTGVDSGKIVTEAFVEGWLLHRPKPMWILVDPQTSLSSGHFVSFLQMTGIGVSVTPGEAHWQAGTIESIIKVMRNTIRRIRNQHPELDPEIIAGLAVNSHNMQYKIKGFSPIQWAYGTSPNWEEEEPGPLTFNSQSQHVPYKFWMTHRHRQEAEDVWRKAHAAEAWTRLKNAAPRPLRVFEVGQWVCVWRTAIWRTRKKNLNPEPRYVGPGRICMVETPVLAENKPAVYWVLMGTQVWRCAPEQLRLATAQEITIEELTSRTTLPPLTELFRKTTRVVDAIAEPGYEQDDAEMPDRPGVHDLAGDSVQEEFSRAQPSSAWQDDQSQMDDSWMQRRKRTRSPKPEVRNAQRQKWRWDQLVSINEARRREGMSPLTDLPHLPSSDEDGLKVETQFYQLDGNQDVEVSEEAYASIVNKINELEETVKTMDERNRLIEKVRQEKQEEQNFYETFLMACDKGEEVVEMIFEIEDHEEFLKTGYAYVKQMMSQPKEINWRNLTDGHKKLVMEAMARELNEVVQSQALRTLKEKMPPDVIQSRMIPMRWLLTWKPLDEWSDPLKESKPGIIREDGWAKAKARIVLIGYKHPDLAQRDSRTGKPLLQTSSPTLSRLGRNLLLQAGALDKHVLECADAKSAFLQADHGIGTTGLYTTAVDEISHALHVPKQTALEIIGAIYGLTNAPRVFWLDADEKLTSIGGESHGIDKCIWTFRNRKGEVCGRVGTHVDDFIIIGDHTDTDWIVYRDKIAKMYRWSPWKKGNFTFAGVQIQQLQNFDILLGQEQFCNELKPIAIENERGRAKDDRLSPKELSQTRGALMKAQWRAIQTAPQYCCRIGLAASTLSKPSLSTMKEANSIIKEMKKSSKDGLILHSFSNERLHWTDVIFLHFGDAARNNRQDGGDTGGFIVGVASPHILNGKESRVSIVDYRSWKLDRPVRGSNGSEAQSLYETEDKGWKCRLFWSILYGQKLTRTNADSLAAMVESLLITDSRGCYDALQNSESPLLGMNNSKTGVELMSVQRGIRDGTNSYITWVPSDLNIADSMTKVSYEAFKTYALWNSRKTWVIRFETEFISARKQQKLRVQQGKPKHLMMDATPGSTDYPDANIWPMRDLA